MRDKPDYERHFVAVQADVFRLAERDYGLTRKRLAALSGVSITTIDTWARGESAMGGPALVHMMRYIPNDLMGLLTEWGGKFVGDLESPDGDLDALGRGAASFTVDYVNAKSDGVVTPMERAHLADKARGMAAMCRAVA